MARAPKTLITPRELLKVELPRDRDVSFEPMLIPKHERHFAGFDERIIALYARGMSVREIQAFLAESYHAEVSPQFISAITDVVLEDTLAWQNRPLERMYPVVFFDALRVKVRTDALVVSKAVYLALGINAHGERDVLGLWIEQTEGAKFWLKVFNELRTRGCQDILIAVVDGLKGLPEAINTVLPNTTVQACIVHLIRNSLDYASWKDRKALAQALRPINTAANEQAARATLQAFAEGTWGAKASQYRHGLGKRAGTCDPVFVFPPKVRRVIYTNNAIENMNRQLRKIIKTRGQFSSDEAVIKLLWLALRNVLATPSRTVFSWKLAMNQFAILFGNRFTAARD